ncbi:uncharacterized protein LY89DRAFT_415640 [Mollisia scopiformis]|uniref:Uncharacterized protein n=1 Tax=Mollisia scopiformis TaxID=149040 RepID=A0A132B1F9_MOLSC|nr:uncharacterized protein LY89DRAFT_415640 [Mollisia scopiformis]KUJ06215.1 hypothetical protein LY89DRAFT_415640 [Mollisia scopiformis]
MFVKGLPPKHRDKLIDKQQYNPDGENTKEAYETMLGAIKGIAESEARKRRVAEEFDEDYHTLQRNIIQEVVNKSMPTGSSRRLPVPEAPTQERVRFSDRATIYEEVENGGAPLSHTTTPSRSQSKSPASSGSGGGARLSARSSGGIEDLVEKLSTLTLGQTNMEQKVSSLSSNVERIVNSLQQNSQQGSRRGSFGNSSGYGVSHGGVGQPYSGQPLRNQSQNQGSQQQAASSAHIETRQNNTSTIDADFGGFGGSSGRGRNWSNNGGSDQPNMCFMCAGRTKNGEPDPNCKHNTIDKCPLTQELILLGVCHRNEEGKICKGPIEPGKEGTRIFFNNSSGRMWEQIIA